MNNYGELFYVDKFDDINKFLNDMEIIIIFIGKIDKLWYLWCLYWFLFLGEFLVVLWRFLWESKVVWYN